MRRELGEQVAVGIGHTALAGYAWYAADRALAERHAEAAIEILAGVDDRRAFGFALSRQAFLAAWRGTRSRRGVPVRRPPRSPPSSAGTRCSAAPRRSGSRWRVSSTATSAAGPTCSPPPTWGCGTGSTTSRPPR
ncbi:hypothetical protein ACFQV8_39820 [Pseudonocardia benzenivorans]